MNEIFSLIFTFEMVIKLTGLGFKGYVSDSFNIFDGTVVILNLLDVVISEVLSADGLSAASGAV